MYEASVTGVFKTVLLIIGALVLVRFIGRLMIAKRNVDEEREMLQRQREFEKEKSEKLKNFGKVTVGKGPKGKTEDVDFTEIQD